MPMLFSTGSSSGPWVRALVMLCFIKRLCCCLESLWWPVSGIWCLISSFTLYVSMEGMWTTTRTQVPVSNKMFGVLKHWTHGIAASSRITVKFSGTTAHGQAMAAGPPVSWSQWFWDVIGCSTHPDFKDIRRQKRRAFQIDKIWHWHPPWIEGLTVGCTWC